MKNSASPSLASIGAAFLGTVLFAAAAVAQAPATAPSAHDSDAHEHEHAPAPTNLKVLPKTMTGEQVHELMHKWEAELGTNCGTCHAADPKNVGPNGKPRLNFPDDSKEAKATARLMYKMVEDINTNYVGKIENSGAPVTCGTCHRGHLDPAPFVAPPDHDHDHHDAPAAVGAKPASSR